MEFCFSFIEIKCDACSGAKLFTSHLQWNDQGTERVVYWILDKWHNLMLSTELICNLAIVKSLKAGVLSVSPLSGQKTQG